MAALVPMGPPPARRQRNLTAILEGFVVKDKDGRLQEISPDFTDTFDDIARTVTESKVSKYRTHSSIPTLQDCTFR